MQPITPYLLYEDGEAAIEFLTRAFGFREVDRVTGSGGGLHAELELPPHGGRIYLGQPQSDFRNPAEVGSTVGIYALVGDVEEHHARASAEGATVTQELNETPFGARQYGCMDPQGHGWYFAQLLDAGDT
jgi:uncharacterized glyoxalase superfamily protein PhnB